VRGLDTIGFELQSHIASVFERDLHSAKPLMRAHSESVRCDASASVWHTWPVARPLKNSKHRTNFCIYFTIIKRSRLQLGQIFQSVGCPCCVHLQVVDRGTKLGCHLRGLQACDIVQSLANQCQSWLQAGPERTGKRMLWPSWCHWRPSCRMCDAGEQLSTLTAFDKRSGLVQTWRASASPQEQVSLQVGLSRCAPERTGRISSGARSSSALCGTLAIAVASRRQKGRPTSG
jgi:hypothetical protein